jgi:hypothetical protein
MHTDEEAARSRVLRICVHLCPICGFSFLLSLLLSLWSAFLIGRNLGLFFGGLILASILAPLLVITEREILRHLTVVASVTAGIGVVWLSCVFNDSIRFGEWSAASLVLLIYTLAVAALAVLLNRIRIPPAVVVVLALAWLCWPIWLAPILRGRAASERVVEVLVSFNPAFAIQGALFRSFPVPWAQHAIAYRLTNIGDDIPYQMPTSILRFLIVHGIIAAIALFAARRKRELTPALQVHPPADQSPRST